MRNSKECIKQPTRGNTSLQSKEMATQVRTTENILLIGLGKHPKRGRQSEKA